MVHIKDDPKWIPLFWETTKSIPQNKRWVLVLVPDVLPKLVVALNRSWSSRDAWGVTTIYGYTQPYISNQTQVWAGFCTDMRPKVSLRRTATSASYQPQQPLRTAAYKQKANNSFSRCLIADPMINLASRSFFRKETTDNPHNSRSWLWITPP